MIKIPLIIRGQIISDFDAEYGGRRPGSRFQSADATRYVDQLAARSAGLTEQLYAISFEEIIDYLHELGGRLKFDANAHLQLAFEMSRETSSLSDAILRFFYERLGFMFDRAATREVAERTVGVDYLQGWVTQETLGGVRSSTRAFGARTVHIVAGNAPIVSAMSIIRNALTRGDAIIKTPSNDPLTASAVALTMIDMAPDHPLTRHLSVAYWKGGDGRVEDALYQPRHVEKIVAWGGMNSVRHVTRYIQPGIELVTLDPKLSASVVGAAAFDDEQTLREAAKLLAQDVGHYNQEGCVNARVVHVQAAVPAVTRFAAMVWEELQRLPAFLSGPAVSVDFGLQDEVESLRMVSDEHTVLGGGVEGGVIVSHDGEPVEFASQLANRIVNLVPFEDLATPLSRIDTSTQTIGVYPDALRLDLRDRLALAGAQRLVTLGYATAGVLSQPQDGIEPMRRICKWVSDESYQNVTSDPWGR